MQMHTLKQSSASRIMLLATGFMAVFLLSCTDDDNDTPEAPAATIQLSSDQTVGEHLVDEQGRTLYLFTSDVKGNSTCVDGCLGAWPEFYEPNRILGSGLEDSDFGTITRADGKMQTTYKGWPLYYFAQDTNPGDIKGENVNQVWFVAKPDYSLMLARQGDRRYLVNEQGQTLYIFKNDAPGVSNCSGRCLEIWPEFFADEVAAPSLLLNSDFQSITRGDGKQQFVYKNQPLYYFANDAARGDTLGGGVNNVWYTVPQ